jgi:hypothetical protein
MCPRKRYAKPSLAGFLRAARERHEKQPGPSWTTWTGK